MSDRDGFTLLEVLIVVCFLAFLTAIVTLFFSDGPKHRDEDDFYDHPGGEDVLCITETGDTIEAEGITFDRVSASGGRGTNEDGKQVYFNGCAYFEHGKP